MSSRESERTCTCHPDDSPPKPCPKRYAIHECREAAKSGAVQHVNSPSPATLAQVARLLGVSEKRAGKMHDGRYVILKDGAFWYYSFGWSGAEQRMSDGDLLLAILNKAAEMGCGYALSHPEGNRPFEMRLTKPVYVVVSAVGSTPLEAALLAFANLPESP